MKIRGRITLGFLGALFLTGVVGAIGWASLKTYADGVVTANAMGSVVLGVEDLKVEVDEFEMTQQNAALVEETTAALHSAQSQVEDLQHFVSFFRTEAGSRDAARLEAGSEPADAELPAGPPPSPADNAAVAAG